MSVFDPAIPKGFPLTGIASLASSVRVGMAGSSAAMTRLGQRCEDFGADRDCIVGKLVGLTDGRVKPS
jgi:hypothetical protein